jgi:hypothetical protein
MTLRTNARLAGATFLFYIAAGMSSLALSGRPQVTELFAVATSFSALVLGVTLYALTRQVDPDIALMGMACRLLEAIPREEGTIYFAVGSTLFSWLFLRGRLIPAALAWLGVLSSFLLVVLLLAQGAGFMGGRTDWSSPITWLIWLPCLVFEIALALWLLIKGVNVPAPQVLEVPRKTG